MGGSKHGRVPQVVLLLCALCSSGPLLAQDEAPAEVPEAVREALSPFRADPASRDVSRLMHGWAEFRAEHPDHALAAAQLWRRAGQNRSRASGPECRFR